MRLIGLVNTIIVARMLSPEDVGIVGSGVGGVDDESAPRAVGEADLLVRPRAKQHSRMPLPDARAATEVSKQEF